MLSRTADSIYWIARYTERAENVARLLDVTHRMSLLPGNDARGYWGAALSANGLDEAYQEKFGEFTAAHVVRFMVLDDDNPSSIRTCLRSARENAHAVRGVITTEFWETLNATWIEMRDVKLARLHGAALAELCEWVKFRSHQARGVVAGTMLRDEAYQFNVLGAFLERADNTARILDVKYDPLAPEPRPGNEYYEWGALLRSVSAFEIYRRVYRDIITPVRVAELLVMRADMPRSLRACMDQVHSTLRTIANSQSTETERRAGKLHAELHYGNMRQILRGGLHAMLTDFLDRTADLGNRISADFLIP
ncbi:MAG: alpha-E domain-containing protein [Gammaproteobacteria bacterium]|nr:alpha-E domain-containing protein [Gammaproteobacteria bacterium]